MSRVRGLGFRVWGVPAKGLGAWGSGYKEG